MEREARYFLVGILLLTATAVGIAFALWSANLTETEETVYYQVHFKGAVSGLNSGSNVFYLGVPIGRVSSLELGEQTIGGVIVHIAVRAETPVTLLTRAQLDTSGLTGQSSLELSNPEDLDQSLPQLEEGQTIPGDASVMEQLAKAAPRIADQTDSALNQLNALLSPENIAAASLALNNIAQAAAAFESSSQEMHLLLRELRTTNDDFQAVIPNIDHMLVSIDETARMARESTLPEFERAAQDLRETSGLISRQVTESSETFKVFVVESQHSMHVIREQIMSTAQKAEQFTDELRSNPSRLLYRPRPTGLEFDK